jgi:hypothetical protein
VILDKNYSLTADAKPIDPEDPTAHIVLGGEGGIIPADTAKKLGLRGLEEYVPYHPNAEEKAAADRQAKADAVKAKKEAEPEARREPEAETEEGKGERSWGRKETPKPSAR